MPQRDVLVVGGGVIGLAIAWRCARDGMAVTLVERGELGRGASGVAAGMLGPVAEAGFGPAARRLLDLGLESARLWPEFAAELAAASDTESALRGGGTLMVARDADEAAELERELAFRVGLGLDVVRLRPSEARRLEPALAPTIRMAAEVPGEQSVDPGWLIAALAGAARAAGAEIREHAPATGLIGSRGRVDGAVIDGRGDRVEGAVIDGRGDRVEGAVIDGRGGRVEGAVIDGREELRAAAVVVAAGPWSGALGPVAVRPVKGQIMRLRDPAGPGLLDRVVRFDGGYVVPRGDGRYVLGATVEERGFDRSVTAGAAYQLLRDASELVPGVLELEICALEAGLRPATPDNLPVIGRADRDGLFWATGHYRNGILLAPVTARLMAAALAGREALVG